MEVEDTEAVMDMADTMDTAGTMALVGVGHSLRIIMVEVGVEAGMVVTDICRHLRLKR
jgi:hypothetical protein